MVKKVREREAREKGRGGVCDSDGEERRERDRGRERELCNVKTERGD